MVEAGSDPLENSTPSLCHNWPPANGCLPLSTQTSSPAHPQPCQGSQDLPLPESSSTLPHPETEGSCMEIEAAQRRLREIEDR